MSLDEIIARALSDDNKRVEPVKRKHGSKYPEWIFHRFPIKNGISPREVIFRNLMDNNVFLNRLKEKA